MQHFASFFNVKDRVRRERELLAARHTLERRVAARTKRLQQANAQLQEEVKRRERTEAVLRDVLERGQEDIHYRDFLVREVNHHTKNALQLAVSLLSMQARHTADATCHGTLKAAVGRLRRIGDVHALLTYGSKARTAST